MTSPTAAVPVCKFEEGCHRVVPCEPGCGEPSPSVGGAVDSGETERPRITTDGDGFLLHLPDVHYLDTQVWAVDVGLSRENLRHLRDAADAVLAVLPAPADLTTVEGGDLIEEYLRFLRGLGPEPDLSDLPPSRREAIAGQFEIVKALADRDPALPPLDQDPVARRLGLLPEPVMQAPGQLGFDGSEEPA